MGRSKRNLASADSKRPSSKIPSEFVIMTPGRDTLSDSEYDDLYFDSSLRNNRHHDPEDIRAAAAAAAALNASRSDSLRYKEEADASKKEVAKLLDEISDLQKAKSSLKIDKMSLETQVRSLHKQLSRFEQALTEKDNRIEELETAFEENLKLLAELEKVEKKEKKKRRSLRRVQTKEWEEKISSTKKEKDQVSEKLDVALEHIQELEAKLAEKEKEQTNNTKMVSMVSEMEVVSALLQEKIAMFKDPSTTNDEVAASKSISRTPTNESNNSETAIVPATRRTSDKPRSIHAASGMAKLRRGVMKIQAINALSKQRFSKWSQTLRRTDPRYQILEFFDEVAQKGNHAFVNCNAHAIGECTNSCLSDENTEDPKRVGTYFESDEEAIRASSVFNAAGVFTVWRPTSLASIRKMIVGEGVGKGLDIKGKSAKKGHFSGFVPFLQLHEEKHKKMVRTIPAEARTRIFFTKKEIRDAAHKQLLMVSVEMLTGYTRAQKTIIRLKDVEASGEELEPEQREENDQLFEAALEKYMWEMEDPTIYLLDDYAPSCWGMEVPQRLLFEAYVMRGDCSRPPGSIHETGRMSEPAFQDMNMETLRKFKPGTPRPVVLLKSDNIENAMDPRYLLIAYEERANVKPVVSDFDCFLVGTRRIHFDRPLPEEQVEMMKWCVQMIEKILDKPPSNESWTMCWLEELKQAYENGFSVTFPKFGFADPKSYSIMAHAVDRLAGHGSVRHGAECFNFYFPQELDDEFLVVTNNQPNGPWNKFSRDGLLKFLSKKVDQGFMFPVNPKWALCDPGWKDLYDKQMMSDNATTRMAVDSWYPPKSGIREMIEGIHARYPQCFQQHDGPYKMENRGYSPLRYAKEQGEEISAEEAMDMAHLEVQHDRVLRKAIKAVNAVLFANRMNRLID